MSTEFPVGFRMRHQIDALAIGVPAQGLGLVEAFVMGKADLGAFIIKYGGCSLLGL